MSKISSEIIKQGYILDNGSLVIPEGYKTILFNGELIGMSIANGSDFAKSLKVEYIKEFDINALNVLAKNKQSDLHFVFDAKKYIGYSQWQSKPIIPPIVIIMLYSRDVRLVMCQLGYPVIDSSQFKK